MTNKRHTRDGRPVYGFQGRRHTADLFRWLSWATTGSTNPCRGVVDSTTGAVRCYGGALPKPITPDPCTLGCRKRRCLAGGGVAHA